MDNFLGPNGDIRDQSEQNLIFSPNVMSGEWAYTLLSVVVVRSVIAAIKQHIPDKELISPQMNLEIDLRLDSLARAERVVSVEQNLGIELKPEEYPLFRE